MIRYTFDEWLKDNQPLDINISMKLRTSFSTPHAHDFYEILFVCENQIVHNLDGENKVMSKHDICLIRPEQSHCAIAPKQGSPTPAYFTMGVEATHFERLTTTIAPDFLQRVKHLPYVTLDQQLHDNCRQTLNKALSLPHGETQAKQYLYQLVISKLIIELASQKPLSISEPDLVKRAISLMKNPQNMGLTIKEIANKLGYTQEYFIRFFKKHNVETPNKLFTKIKLDYACELLCNTDYSITKICETIGLYSLHYFNQLFKSYFGMSPVQYRKKYTVNV